MLSKTLEPPFPNIYPSRCDLLTERMFFMVMTNTLYAMRKSQ